MEFVFIHLQSAPYSTFEVWWYCRGENLISNLKVTTTWISELDTKSRAVTLLTKHLSSCPPLKTTLLWPTLLVMFRVGTQIIFFPVLGGHAPPVLLGFMGFDRQAHCLCSRSFYFLWRSVYPRMRLWQKRCHTCTISFLYVCKVCHPGTIHCICWQQKDSYKRSVSTYEEWWAGLLISNQKFNLHWWKSKINFAGDN